MTKEAFDKIKAGLDEALEYARGGMAPYLIKEKVTGRGLFLTYDKALVLRLQIDDKYDVVTVAEHAASLARVKEAVE